MVHSFCYTTKSRSLFLCYEDDSWVANGAEAFAGGVGGVLPSTGGAGGVGGVLPSAGTGGAGGVLPSLGAGGVGGVPPFAGGCGAS